MTTNTSVAMPQKPKEQTVATKPHLYLSADNVTLGKSPDGQSPRMFEGVANSGMPFDYYGVRTIIDLSEVHHHDKVPALIEHERSLRAGFGSLSVEDHQLLIKGQLLSNDHANSLADDADDGFPLQMSAHVIAGRIDELFENQTTTVNGQTVTGPILILRQCRIPEVSFTPTGVDSETNAVILSEDLKRHAQPLKLSDSLDSSKPTQSEQKDKPMTLEQALAKIVELEKAIAEKDETIETLKAEKQELIDEKEALAKEKHEADVEAQLSQAGFSKSEDGKTWQGVSEGTVNVLLSSDLDSAKAIIADLKPTGGGNADNPMPDALLGEQFAGVQHEQDGVKLSNNPLMAVAEARSKG